MSNLIDNILEKLKNLYIKDLENDKQSVTLEPEKHENNSNARQQNKTKCC